MARTNFKWKFAVFSYLILVNVFIKSLPIETRSRTLITTDTTFEHSEHFELPDILTTTDSTTDAVVPTEEITIESSTALIDESVTDLILNTSRNALTRQNLRPGQTIRNYAVQLTPSGDTFIGRAVITLELTLATREDPIMLQIEDLNVQSIMVGLVIEANAVQADYDIDDGILEIFPPQLGSSYIVIISYTGSLTFGGRGLYRGQFESFNYLGMNLHPTNARRLFPCIDTPDRNAEISFTFNNIDYTHIVSNTLQEDSNVGVQFQVIESSPHLWSMIAHTFNNVIIPVTNVPLFIRPGVTGQEALASTAISNFFNALNEWTNKPYFEFHNLQSPQLSVLALPDVSVDWYGMSIVGVWEPYILMETTSSARQRYMGMVKIAEALSRKWFGFGISPENWRDEWIISGLASYSAWDIVQDFQSDPFGNDASMIDINTMFVTDIIQESLYRDAYTTAQIIEPPDRIFEEDEVRYHVNGLLKYKAPALMKMFRLVLDETEDVIQAAGRTLLTSFLETKTGTHFVDAINAVATPNLVDDIEEYLEPWTTSNGYPLIHVGLVQNGVLVTMERFGFISKPSVVYDVPLTYSVSTNHNFDNIFPVMMMDRTLTLPMVLNEDDGDYVLLNVQGQGYYRVNYDNNLWERIIDALNDPDRRAEIHPLNRATLIDDALNLARAGRIGYDIAFEVVLAMEHETEYAPWKAFIRNMDFLRIRLVAMVEEDDDLDPDIYLRMVRRTIGTFENEIGFYPELNVLEPAMVSLTRGLVMDHACRANYAPCIAAAVDWFWNPNDASSVNPDIPRDLRPAVYCTMVREGDNDVVSALYARLAIEPVMYERVVILESLACSRDGNFVRNLLEETIAANTQYTTEERLSIFKSAAASSYDNTWIAMSFMIARTNAMVNMYGGRAKFEEAIEALSNNLAFIGQSGDFQIWVNSQTNQLDESEFAANEIARRVLEEQEWVQNYLDDIYEWIDENDAPTIFVSSFLILISCIVTLLNH